jgi:hypothetical protein
MIFSRRDGTGSRTKNIKSTSLWFDQHDDAKVAATEADEEDDLTRHRGEDRYVVAATAREFLHLGVDPGGDAKLFGGESHCRFLAFRRGRSKAALPQQPDRLTGGRRGRNAPEAAFGLHTF